jgi:HAD superfamily hydrolase (TIGR01509 family)
MKAILFGSIGTLVETSEMQRKSFNLAFKEFGLDWYWNTATYCRLITQPGGMKRIQEYSENELTDTEVIKIHALKENFFGELVPGNLYIRPNVKDVIYYAKINKIKLGFITTTSQSNIDLIKDGVRSELNFNTFDLITNVEDVKHAKPSPDVYKFALKKLKIDPAKALAIEDTPVNHGCAVNAGLKCILFPGEYAEVPANNRYQTLTYNLMDKLESEILSQK